MTVGVERAVGRQPVMADVARLAGVSQKTVSRVINDAPNVRDSVRERVLQAVAELGYRPNAAARALVTQQTRVLGVAMPGSTDYGPSAQLFGIETAAWDLGYSVVVASAPRRPPRTSRAPSSGSSTRGSWDWSSSTPTSTTGSPRRSSGTSRPSTSARSSPRTWGARPCPWTRRAGRALAVGHLLGLGHRTVHHLAGPGQWGSAVRRTVGWREALVAAGAPVVEPLHGDWSSRSGYLLGLELAGDPEVTAVFAANDQMAVGAMRAFTESGRRRPGAGLGRRLRRHPRRRVPDHPADDRPPGLRRHVAHRAVTALVAAVEGRPGSRRHPSASRSSWSSAPAPVRRPRAARAVRPPDPPHPTDLNPSPESWSDDAPIDP